MYYNIIQIGIDKATYIRKYAGHFNRKCGESKSYALWDDEDRNKWDHNGIIVGHSPFSLKMI